MFPSAGYFKGINCPFYDDEGCERIYCHFRHVPKGLSAHTSSTSCSNVKNAGTSIEDLVSQAVKRVLSENEELIRSLDVHQRQQVIQTTVKSSVLESTAPFQSFFPAPRKYTIPSHVPAYNPTPIKLLEKAKTSANADISDVYIVSDYSKDKYDSFDSAYKPSSIDETVEPKFSSDEDEEAAEKFKTISGNIQETYDPTKDVKIQSNYHPSKINPAQGSYTPFLDQNSYCLDYKPSRKECDEREEKADAKYELSNVKEANKYIPSKPKAFEEYNPTKTVKEGTQLSVYLPQNESEVSSTTIERAKSFEEAQEKIETKEDGERLGTNQKRERTVSNERKGESKKAKKKDQSRSSSREKRRHKEKRASNKHKKRYDRSKSEDRKGRSRDRKKHGSSKEERKVKDSKKDRERKSSKDKDRKSSKEKDKDRKSSKEKDKLSKHTHRKSSTNREKKSSQDERQKYKDSGQEIYTEQKLQERELKEKRCSKEKEVDSKSSERDYKSDKSKKGEETKKETTKENEHNDNSSSGQEVGEDYFPDLSMLEELDDIFEDLEEEDLNNEQLMEECYKIFQEYKPEPNKVLATEKAEVQEPPQIALESSINKKRLAHTGYNMIPLGEPPSKIAKMNPALVMQERLRLMKEIYMMKKEAAQANRNPQACPTVSSSSEPSTSGLRASAKKRIAHVPNVQGLLKKPIASNAIPVTNFRTSVTKYGQTNVKGAQRVAHMPSEVLIERPIIAPDSANKVPVTIRQRYLNIIIDHILNVGTPAKEAYEQAVEEEKAAYIRSGNKSVYLNAIVSAINRLKKAAEGAKAAAAQGVKQTVSHLDILAGKGGAKGSWSFERAKKTPDVLSGSLLYKLLEKYILTQEQLESNGFPMPDPAEKGRAKMVLNTFRKKVELPTLESPFERRCDRCSVVFVVDNRGILVKKEECIYHWGKPIKRRGIGGLETKFSCCGCDMDATGCSVGSSHVIKQADLNCVKGFVSTLPKDPSDESNFGVYALDCEMCYTTGGIELTRLTVIGSDSQIVYETMVMPDNPILDYNTRFSGISEEQLRGVTTSLRDVQAVLLSKFSDKTILIGHSLESDFKALKLIHPTVVDTSVVFPHKMGPPYKRALKTLSADILKKIIQNDVSGHDSAEDAIACMELMLWKVKEDMKMLR